MMSCACWESINQFNDVVTFRAFQAIRGIERNQLLQLCTARVVFSILVTVQYGYIHCDAGGVSLLTNEKQRKIDIRLTDQ